MENLDKLTNIVTSHLTRKELTYKELKNANLDTMRAIKWNGMIIPAEDIKPLLLSIVHQINSEVL